MHIYHHKPIIPSYYIFKKIKTFCDIYDNNYHNKKHYNKHYGAYNFVNSKEKEKYKYYSTITNKPHNKFNGYYEN